MPFPVARIDLATGLVVNVELADQEWLDANQGADGCTFVAYTPEQPAAPGLGYDEVTGFEQPATDDSITVTRAELDVLVADEVAKVTEVAAPVKR